MANILNTRDDTNVDSDALCEGDRLSQSEFHRRYELLSDGPRYELLNGVVCMTPAERMLHGRYGYLISLVLGLYEEKTPGVAGAQNSSLILDERNEPQADLHFRIRADHHGTSTVDDEGYVTGPPELVIEIAYSSLKRDLTVKREIYRELGVREYLIVCVEPAELHWYSWPEGERKLDSDGILRSVVFPGLWIDSHALFQEHTTALFKTIRMGLKTEAHAEFVSQMKLRKQP